MGEEKNLSISAFALCMVVQRSKWVVSNSSLKYRESGEVSKGDSGLSEKAGSVNRRVRLITAVISAVYVTGGVE